MTTWTWTLAAQSQGSFAGRDGAGVRGQRQIQPGRSRVTDRGRVHEGHPGRCMVRTVRLVACDHMEAKSTRLLVRNTTFGH
jgi:hypothetical protein